jgi:hypothetical protein
MKVTSYENEIEQIKELMKQGYSLNYSAREILGFGGTKTTKITEIMLQEEDIVKPLYRWKLTEVNKLITYTLKIKKTRSKKDRKNWIEFEINCTTIVDGSTDTLRVVKEISEKLDDIVDELMFHLYGYVDPDNIVEDYDIDDTDKNTTYPTMDYEWLIRTPQFIAGKTGKGSTTL